MDTNGCYDRVVTAREHFLERQLGSELNNHGMNQRCMKGTELTLVNGCLDVEERLCYHIAMK